MVKKILTSHGLGFALFGGRVEPFIVANHKNMVLAADKVAMGKIENDMLRRLNDRGTDSSTVRGIGVAFKKTRTYCSVADWDIFFKYVQDHNAWHMITHAASKDAVAEFKEAHNDLPPGLDWTETIAVSFNRSS